MKGRLIHRLAADRQSRCCRTLVPGASKRRRHRKIEVYQSALVFEIRLGGAATAPEVRKRDTVLKTNPCGKSRILLCWERRRYFSIHCRTNADRNDCYRRFNRTDPKHLQRKGRFQHGKCVAGCKQSGGRLSEKFLRRQSGRSQVTRFGDVSRRKRYPHATAKVCSGMRAPGCLMEAPPIAFLIRNTRAAR